jgi:hypothetical protein
VAIVDPRTWAAPPATGVLAAIGEDHLFHTIDEAVQALAAAR